MPRQVKFSTSPPGGDRVHYVSEADVRIVLNRLPFDLWNRLRTVHFNDRSRGPRFLGYVNPRGQDIAVCALPPRISLTRALRMGQTPEQFGATRGKKWPVLPIRRFMLYNVFLHELGHLQLVDEETRSIRLKFAREKLAQEFAMHWCSELWSKPFPHPDPVHNPPTPENFAHFPLKRFLLAAERRVSSLLRGHARDRLVRQDCVRMRRGEELYDGRKGEKDAIKAD